MQFAEITNKDTQQRSGPLRGQCCVKPGGKIKGTFFLGGAGMDGVYIPKMIQSFHSAGIASAIHLDRDKWSGGQALDVAAGVFIGREYDPRFPMLLRMHSNSHEQFNLIGYSYGSIIAAQLAAKYSRGGTIVNNLVLIGSPISNKFLSQLKSNRLINKVTVIDLDEQGDPIYAGMKAHELITSTPKLFLQMNESSGHFYYAEKGTIGDNRRNTLAKELYEMGLR